MTRLDQAAKHRLLELADVVRSGATESVGKGLRSETGEVVRRGRGGVGILYPELIRAGVAPGVAAKAIARGKGIIYRRLHAAARWELAAYIPEAKRYEQKPVIPPHRKLTRKCKRCKIWHGKGEHRFHGPGAFQQTHLFAFNPPMKYVNFKYVITRVIQGRSSYWSFNGWQSDSRFAEKFVSGDEAQRWIEKNVLYNAFPERMGRLTRQQNPVPRRRKVKRRSMAPRRMSDLSKKERLEYERYRRSANPRRGAVMIYGQVEKVFAKKSQKHKCDAACKKTGHRYWHAFKVKPRMYGLPDGSILIKK